jgi:hypothetical protein
MLIRLALLAATTLAVCWGSDVHLSSDGISDGTLGYENQPGVRASRGHDLKVTLSVTTSAVRGAGTNSGIHVTFFGTYFTSPEVLLPGPFHQGATDSIVLTLPDHIGTITSLQVRGGRAGGQAGGRAGGRAGGWAGARTTCGSSAAICALHLCHHFALRASR